MSATNSAEPGSASTDALLRSAFDSKGIGAIDRRIADLRQRILTTSPRFAKRALGYREEIDLLLDMRLWLKGAVGTAG